MIAVRCSSLLATIALLAVSTAAASDESLARAKDLYRTAAYDEALAVLDQIVVESSAATRVEASEYRLFCLIALDRKSEARAAIESMVDADPFYQLTTDQASPRVRAMFQDIRQSLLPGMVQREYAAAKAAFDRQDVEAAAQFDRVLKLLDDPQLTPTPAFVDLRTVASGFRDLSKARAPKVEFAAAIAPTPQPQSNAPVTTAASATTGSQAASAQVRSEPAVFRDGDAGVVPPVTLNQSLPQWLVPQGARPGTWQPEAVLEVTIDESGKVLNAILRKSFHPTYDSQLVKAALNWKYEPARKDGVAVRFTKMISVRLEGAN